MTGTPARVAPHGQLLRYPWPPITPRRYAGRFSLTMHLINNMPCAPHERWAAGGRNLAAEWLSRLMACDDRVLHGCHAVAVLHGPALAAWSCGQGPCSGALAPHTPP